MFGRIGTEAAVETARPRPRRPRKMVWQSAAWALRRLGNRGLGLDTIRAALGSPLPAVRRGAARIFAYQFYGMDDRVEMRDAFFPLLADPDLLTRHQAVGLWRNGGIARTIEPHALAFSRLWLIAWPSPASIRSSVPIFPRACTICSTKISARRHRIPALDLLPQARAAGGAARRAALAGAADSAQADPAGAGRGTGTTTAGPSDQIRRHSFLARLHDSGFRSGERSDV